VLLLRSTYRVHPPVLGASRMITGGVNAKTLCTYMGHASILITYDLCGT
jgi:hypothetical protein